MTFHQVNEVLSRPVSLSVNDIPPSEKVVNVQWELQAQNGKRLIIAEFRDGKWERPDPKDQFGQRLETVNETTLKIQNLKKGDGGVYKVCVILHPAKMQEHTFRLTVHNPVPKPKITALQETAGSSGKCNVTLECSVPEKEGVNVSWRIGDTLQPLEGGLARYRLSSKGRHLHLSNPMDSRVTCLVSNPADQKMASFDVTSICRHLGGNFSPFPVEWVVILFAIVLATVFWIWKKWWKRPNSKGGSQDSRGLNLNKRLKCRMCPGQSGTSSSVMVNLFEAEWPKCNPK